MRKEAVGRKDGGRGLKRPRGAAARTVVACHYPVAEAVLLCLPARFSNTLASQSRRVVDAWRFSAFHVREQHYGRRRHGAFFLEEFKAHTRFWR